MKSIDSKEQIEEWFKNLNAHEKRHIDSAIDRINTDIEIALLNLFDTAKEYREKYIQMSNSIEKTIEEKEKALQDHFQNEMKKVQAQKIEMSTAFEKMKTEMEKQRIAAEGLAPKRVVQTFSNIEAKYHEPLLDWVDKQYKFISKNPEKGLELIEGSQKIKELEGKVQQLSKNIHDSQEYIKRALEQNKQLTEELAKYENMEGGSEEVKKKTTTRKRSAKKAAPKKGE